MKSLIRSTPNLNKEKRENGNLQAFLQLLYNLKADVARPSFNEGNG
jgi:hypothetical protein